MMVKDRKLMKNRWKFVLKKVKCGFPQTNREISLFRSLLKKIEEILRFLQNKFVFLQPQIKTKGKTC